MSIRKLALAGALALSLVFNNAAFAQEAGTAAAVSDVKPIEKAKLVLLRHGETTYNRFSLLTGRWDVPLTPEGEEQARKAGPLIAGIRFDKVYTSTLSRTYNTATLALQASRTQTHLLDAEGIWQIEQRAEIDEIDFGAFAGRSKDDPEVVNWKKAHDLPFPGGESKEQLAVRVQKFYDMQVTPRLQRGENVLIVGHAHVLRALEKILNGGDGVKRRVPNAIPKVYVFKNGTAAGETLKKSVPEASSARNGK